MPSKLLVKAILWFMSTDTFKWISDNIIAKYSVRIKGYPKFPISIYHYLKEEILVPEPNTFYTFASTDQSSLASILIRKVVGNGTFTHAGLILPGSTPRIMHMMGEGLQFWDILELLKEIDYLCINKIVLSDENYKIAMDRVDWIVKNSYRINYDYQQRIGNGDTFYCSEQNYFIFDGLTDDPDLVPEVMYGIKTFSPDKVTKIGEIVYTNHPKLKKG